MRVVLTETARQDLIAIRKHISRANPKRAASFVSELLDCCLELRSLPQRFPFVPRYEHHGIRRRVHQDYLIFYRVGSEVVQIIHILHGAQDYEAMLFSSG